MSEKRRNPEQFQLRMPPGMRDRLKASAGENDRSLNAEIVARLEASLDGSSPEIEALKAQAAKFESLMRQARSRLGVVRSERERLAEYVRVVSGDLEREMAEARQQSSLDDSALLLKIYFEIKRIGAEMVLNRSIEDNFKERDWERNEDDK